MNNNNMDQTLGLMESKHSFEYMNTYYSAKIEEQKTMYDLTSDIQLLDNIAYLVSKFRNLVARNQPKQPVIANQGNGQAGQKAE
ncbi:hypothetical protein M2S00_06790 [Apilactobacillus sp. TMW 2.2459]|uniref:hypothetical protein n=1 Tax=Apilactobacillus xinyiensis TaxID=2841032 RepID=UPI00200FF814|nr:hypothetical protein [Apilactobacillus xinyiensis]MCL0312811.1 hypothetical protein [Apilactobacillus xinyiensis]